MYIRSNTYLPIELNSKRVLPAHTRQADVLPSESASPSFDKLPNDR